MCDFGNIQPLDSTSYNFAMQLTLDIARFADNVMEPKPNAKSQPSSSRAAPKSGKKNQLSTEKEEIGQQQAKKQKVPAPPRFVNDEATKIFGMVNRKKYLVERPVDEEKLKKGAPKQSMKLSTDQKFDVIIDNFKKLWSVIASKVKKPEETDRDFIKSIPFSDELKFALNIDEDSDVHPSEDEVTPPMSAE
ncbi:hypothetical protein A4A49_01242 [Nicotiana attenuata]|uniref:Uncharacterized protein n=1 Tax=Nicotiana attenuata TaxID=49451 RepID=A0A1J6IGB4_NICAT|nr:hypothetical protein A4A49_01242 [Nicotiana attenuata]